MDHGVLDADSVVTYSAIREHSSSDSARRCDAEERSASDARMKATTSANMVDVSFDDAFMA